MFKKKTITVVCSSFNLKAITEMTELFVQQHLYKRNVFIMNPRVT